MKIKMLKTKKGSPDGAIVNTYLVGREYDMPDSLADVFVDQLHVAKKVVAKFIYIAPPLINIETPEQPKIEIIQKPVMEIPMKKIRKAGRPAGSKNKKRKKNNGN